MFEAPLTRSYLPFLEQKHLTLREVYDFEDVYVWTQQGSGIKTPVKYGHALSASEYPVIWDVYLDPERITRTDTPKRVTKLFYRGWLSTQFRVEFDVLETEWVQPDTSAIFDGQACWRVTLESERPCMTR